MRNVNRPPRFILDYTDNVTLPRVIGDERVDEHRGPDHMNIFVSTGVVVGRIVEGRVEI